MVVGFDSFLPSIYSSIPQLHVPEVNAKSYLVESVFDALR